MPGLSTSFSSRYAKDPSLKSCCGPRVIRVWWLLCSERERGRVLAGAGIKVRGAERNKNKNKSHSSFDGFSVGHSGSIPLRASSSVCSSDRQVQDHHLPRCPALPRTPPVLGNFVWVRRLFLASSSSLRPRGERVENPFCMRSSPPHNSNSFPNVDFLCFV